MTDTDVHAEVETRWLSKSLVAEQHVTNHESNLHTRTSSHRNNKDTKTAQLLQLYTYFTP